MNFTRKLSIVLVGLVGLSLFACKSSPEPPSDRLISDLLNEHSGESGEYIINAKNECLVEADEVDVVEAWGVNYWRTDVDGGFDLFVRIVKNSAGEWSVSGRNTCAVR